MKENPMDDVLDRVMSRQQAVSETIAQRFKGTSPFATEKLSPTAKIWAIDNIGTEDMSELIDEFGQDAIGHMLYQVNKMRTDKRRTRWQTEQM